MFYIISLVKYFLHSYLLYDRSIENSNTLWHWYSQKDHHTSSNNSTINQNENPYTTGGINLSSPTSSFVDNEDTKDMVHCTSPVGSMDGSILVESESGEFSDFTTLQVSQQCKFLEIPVKSYDKRNLICQYI